MQNGIYRLITRVSQFPGHSERVYAVVKADLEEKHSSFREGTITVNLITEKQFQEGDDKSLGQIILASNPDLGGSLRIKSMKNFVDPGEFSSSLEFNTKDHRIPIGSALLEFTYAFFEALGYESDIDIFVIENKLLSYESNLADFLTRERFMIKDNSKGKNYKYLSHEKIAERIYLDCYHSTVSAIKKTYQEIIIQNAPIVDMSDWDFAEDKTPCLSGQDHSLRAAAVEAALKSYEGNSEKIKILLDNQKALCEAKTIEHLPLPDNLDKRWAESFSNKPKNLKIGLYYKMLIKWQRSLEASVSFQVYGKKILDDLKIKSILTKEGDYFPFCELVIDLTHSYRFCSTNLGTGVIADLFENDLLRELIPLIENKLNNLDQVWTDRFTEAYHLKARTVADNVLSNGYTSTEEPKRKTANELAAEYKRVSNERLQLSVTLIDTPDSSVLSKFIVDNLRKNRIYNLNLDDATFSTLQVDEIIDASVARSTTTKLSLVFPKEYYISDEQAKKILPHFAKIERVEFKQATNIKLETMEALHWNSACHDSSVELYVGNHNEEFLSKNNRANKLATLNCNDIYSQQFRASSDEIKRMTALLEIKKELSSDLFVVSYERNLTDFTDTEWANFFAVASRNVSKISGKNVDRISIGNPFNVNQVELPQAIMSSILASIKHSRSAREISLYCPLSPALLLQLSDALNKSEHRHYLYINSSTITGDDLTKFILDISEGKSQLSGLNLQSSAVVKADLDRALELLLAKASHLQELAISIEIPAEKPYRLFYKKLRECYALRTLKLNSGLDETGLLELTSMVGNQSSLTNLILGSATVKISGDAILSLEKHIDHNKNMVHFSPPNIIQDIQPQTDFYQSCKMIINRNKDIQRIQKSEALDSYLLFVIIFYQGIRSQTGRFDQNTMRLIQQYLVPNHILYKGRLAQGVNLIKENMLVTRSWQTSIDRAGQHFSYFKMWKQPLESMESVVRQAKVNEKPLDYVKTVCKYPYHFRQSMYAVRDALKEASLKAGGHLEMKK